MAGLPWYRYGYKNTTHAHAHALTHGTKRPRFVSNGCFIACYTTGRSLTYPRRLTTAIEQFKMQKPRRASVLLAKLVIRGGRK